MNAKKFLGEIGWSPDNSAHFDLVASHMETYADTKVVEIINDVHEELDAFNVPRDSSGPIGTSFPKDSYLSFESRIKLLGRRAEAAETREAILRNTLLDLLIRELAKT